jgi:hypothetical protein
LASDQADAWGLAIIRVIALGGYFGNLLHNKTNSVRNTRHGLSATTKIAIPPDLAGMFTACEDAYEQATREGYAENPAVVAAIADLKSAWKALHVANYNLMTAKGFFAAEFATVRTERACWATTEARCSSAASPIAAWSLIHAPRA